jgi:hypothetical protein
MRFIPHSYSMRIMATCTEHVPRRGPDETKAVADRTIGVNVCLRYEGRRKGVE